jgi:hypothetical protein
VVRVDASVIGAAGWILEEMRIDGAGTDESRLNRHTRAHNAHESFQRDAICATPLLTVGLGRGNYLSSDETGTIPERSSAATHRPHLLDFAVLLDITKPNHGATFLNQPQHIHIVLWEERDGNHRETPLSRLAARYHSPR